MRVPKHKVGDIVKQGRDTFMVLEVNTSSYGLKCNSGRYKGRITRRTCMNIDKTRGD